MTKEEHTTLINNIRTAESDIERNSFLAQLTADYDGVLATATENATKIETLEKENIEYARLNNQLFLQIGNPTINNEPPKNEPPLNEPPTKRSFSDLKFD